MEKMIKEMFELQEELNDNVNGKFWKKGITKTNQEINWMRCVRFEMIEAIDQSFQWKHWKNNKVNNQYDIIDLHNLKIEFVDTYHFLMSELLKYDKFKNNILNLNIKKIIPFKFENSKDLVLKIEDFIDKVRLYEKNNYSIIDLYINFWNITLSIMSISEFYNLYISKNVLNLFRLRNGYQEGTYIKNWGNEKIEDNVFLEKYLNNNKNIDFKKIYDYLNNKYKKLNKTQ